MPVTAYTGLKPRTTVEEPRIENGDECAFCQQEADGYDATVEQPLCRDCAKSFASFRYEVLGVDR